MTDILFENRKMAHVLVFVLAAVCAFVSVTWTKHAGGVATIWPANAIIVVAMLRSSRSDGWLYVMALCVMTVLINLGDHRPWGIVLGFAVANMAEVTMAALLVRRISPIAHSFEQPGWAFRFAVAIFASVVVSAMIAGGALSLSEHHPWIAGSEFWTMSHLPGLLIIVPMLLALYPQGDRHRLATAEPHMTTTLFLMAFVAATSVVIFSQSRYPIQFLILPSLLLATYHLNAKGAALSVAIVAVIGSFFILTKTGPLMQVHGPAAVKIYLFQLYLVTIFFCALPLGAVLTQRDQKTSLAEQRFQDFRHLADRVGDVLFRADAAGRWRYLNPAYARMSGFDVNSKLGQFILDDVVPEDRPALTQAQAELTNGTRDEIRLVVSIHRRDGTVRHVEILAYRLDEGDGFGGLIRDVTDQMTLEAQNRQIAAAYETAANTDELTSLPNRRAFFQVLGVHLSDATPSDSLTVALFDLDHFKRVNDQYGHPAGDVVLRHVAQTVRATMRECDMVARIGGEEFAILIVGESYAQAVAMARRTLRAVSAAPIVLPDGPMIHVTISMGLATRTDHEDRDMLISRADQALYAAKRTGRNRLEEAPMPSDQVLS
ncbi:diguanylate cyclase [Gluconacetobacter azotocaptans]|uniref:sensor domain-containing diguanylate cyclase n=1 Tax=Gluconacetobacter azotocaptans TaxID=142834 RepID=UPI00195CBB5D|nr:diguanylate cyclase [Gluconacetobacter azotocaptans]MBM9401778.1 diguanylate cyclase [Gluconacetobacter azotocaptans]